MCNAMVCAWVVSRAGQEPFSIAPQWAFEAAAYCLGIACVRRC